MYENIKKWYNMGLWSKEKVHDAVNKNIITEEQYNKIINEIK